MTEHLHLSTILEQVAAERDRQDQQWGGADHDDDHGELDWLGFVEDHAKRARKALPAKKRCGDLDEYRKQLIEIAALAVAAVAAYDRAAVRTAVRCTACREAARISR